MSGKPNPEQIEQLRVAATEIARLGDEIARLDGVIADASLTRENARHERVKRQREVLTLLDSMDVAANHNFGWEARVVYFLSTLARQAEQYGRKHP